MAKKAHQRHLEIERGAALDLDKASHRNALTESHSKRVAPWLTLNAEVGNIYTGSLFLALIDLLRQAGDAISGRPVSLFSYGSGCGATFCVGEVTDRAADWAQALDPTTELEQRLKLAMSDYERCVQDGESADTAAALDPASYGLSEGLFYVGTVDHQRRYVRG